MFIVTNAPREGCVKSLQCQLGIWREQKNI